MHHAEGCYQSVILARCMILIDVPDAVMLVQHAVYPA